MMRKFLRTKRGLLIAVCVLFASVLGLSYATFIVNNGSYKATELLISKLNYGITIVEDGSTGSTIDNNSVTIPGGKTGYYVVTITSINSINTKYSLGYKTTSNATVQYTDRTAWEASGEIKGYDENTYSKKVRIVIDNSDNSSSATVSFAAFGGYTYRTIAEINLTDGYKTVTGPFTELALSKTNKLIDIVEGDTSCTTSDTTNCLYGGGNLKNYVQFPEDEDKTKNIWRIVGSYDINGSYVTKLISETLISTTSSNYVADLTTFYNTLTGIDAYIEETNYFNCYSTSCTANTNFTNIGLLTDYEFDEIGGVNTYLNRKMPFIVNSEEGLKEVTKNGYNEAVSASTNARAVIYLKNKTHVINSGTEADPYILSPETDVAIIGYTVNGKATSEKFNDLLKTNLVNEITCDKGTTAVWDNETSSIKLSNIKAPDYCTIDFKDGFTVTLTAGSTGTVSAPISQMVGYNGTLTFTVTSNNEYTTLSKNTCRGTLSGNTYTISNIKENKACEIEFGAAAQTIYDVLLYDNPTISTRSDFSTTFTTNTTNTLYKATENSTDVYYFAGQDTASTPVNNWVKFGGFYWRIIRTNSDGSIRLLYAGTAVNTTEAYIGTSKFNNLTNDSMYVGYKYGTSNSSALDRSNTNDSLIKGVVDSWYNSNLSDYADYLSTDAVYCNDREIGSGTYSTNGSTFLFAAYSRLSTNKNPSYNCTNSKDAFSTSNSDAKLTYPIALMTADEIAYAGGVYNTNAPMWYYTNSSYASITGSNRWYLMSPSHWQDSTYAVVLRVGASDDPGRLFTHSSNTTASVRPVISIKGDLKWKSGDGSSSSPYELDLPVTLYSKLLEDNPTISTRTDFSTAFTSNTVNTLYKATENGTDVYYFAGQDTESTPINNWVKFGKNSSNQDLYWRIIRTNADGSIRLLYHGTSTAATDAYIGTSRFNEKYNDSMYVGYMYGTSGSQESNRTNTNNSIIKTAIDNWYASNMTSYTKYLSTTAVYCNDREVGSTSSATGSTFYYAAYTRLYENKTPTYDCANTKDAFSVNNNEAKLKYPISLMTADEIAYAGGVARTIAPMWYYTNSSLESSTGKTFWWTMTPYYWINSISSVWDVYGSDFPGDLGFDNVVNSNAVRPVVSLKSCIKYSTGNGTSETPYEIVETSSGC